MPDKVVEERNDEEMASLLGPSVTAKKKQPIRRAYEDGQSGQSSYLDDMRTFAKAESERAKMQTNRAERDAAVFGRAYDTLKAVKTYGTDPALSVGAILAPGPGTALNAIVKGIDSAQNAAKGNYASSALSAADAALPFAGRIPGIAKAGSGIAQGLKYVQNPVTGAVEHAFAYAPIKNAMSSISKMIAASPATMRIASTISPSSASSVSKATADIALRDFKKSIGLEVDDRINNSRSRFNSFVRSNPGIMSSLARIASYVPVSVTGSRASY